MLEEGRPEADRIPEGGCFWVGLIRLGAVRIYGPKSVRADGVPDHEAERPSRNGSVFVMDDVSEIFDEWWAVGGIVKTCGS